MNAKLQITATITVTIEKSCFLSLIFWMQTNESNFLSRTLECVNGVGAPTAAVTEGMSAYGNSEAFVGALLTVQTNGCVSTNIALV